MNPYQYNLVQRLPFLRHGGTENELHAAEILMTEIEATGGEGEYQEFKIPAYKFRKYSLKVV